MGHHNCDGVFVDTQNLNDLWETNIKPYIDDHSISNR